MAIYGVDVHDGYQAGLSFPLLYQQGYRFAAVKLTEGTSYVRAAGDDWIRAAREAGLLAGAYHWLTAADGAAQARWFHQQLQQVGGPAGLLIQLDCEDDGYGPQIRAWAAEWERLTGGYPFFIYSGKWWWNSPDRPMGSVNGAAVTPYLWDSHYLIADLDTVPDDPAAFAARIPASWWVPGYGGWQQATIMQFTSKGDAGSLANKVDLNVYRGTLDQLRALTGAGGQEDGDMTPEEHNVLYKTATQVDRLTEGAWSGYAVVTNTKTAADGVKALAADVAAMKTALMAVLAAGTSVDTVALVDKLQDLADADRARDEQHAAELSAVLDMLTAAKTAAADAEARAARLRQALVEAGADLAGLDEPGTPIDSG